MAIEALSNIVRGGESAFGGTSASPTDVDVLLSSAPRKAGHFDITNAEIAANSRIILEQLPGPYFGKGTLADEFEMMGPVNFVAVPKAGKMTVHWNSPYYQKGYFKLRYTFTTPAVVPPGDSPPAVYATGKGVVKGGTGEYPEVTFSNVVAGDLIVAFTSKYYGDEGLLTISDTIDGSYTDSATYTKQLPTSVDVGSGANMLLNVFTTVASSNSATRKVRFNNDGYASMIVIIVRGAVTSSIFDNSGSFPTNSGEMSGDVVLNNPVSTNANNLILAYYGWYQSGNQGTVNGDWPLIEGFNDGDGQTNQSVVVGKQVTAIGNYDPVFSMNNYTSVGGISVVIKGPTS